MRKTSLLLAGAMAAGLTQNAQAQDTELVDMGTLERCMIESLETVLSVQEGDMRDTELESVVAPPPNMSDFYYSAEHKIKTDDTYKRITLQAGLENLNYRRRDGHDDFLIMATYDSNVEDKSLAAVFEINVSSEGMQSVSGQPVTYNDIQLLDYSAPNGSFEVPPEDRTENYQDILDAVASVAFFTSLCLGQDPAPSDANGMVNVPALEFMWD